MARQFREQLEEEVQLEQARKAQPPPAPPPEEKPAAAHPSGATGTDPTVPHAGATPSADERRA
jgi:hypothetical protein